MYEYASQIFRRKQDVVEFIRDILYRYPISAKLSDHDFEFMMAILACHPSAEDKIGCGVRHMYVGANPEFPQNRGFWIVRLDGTETDWSFVKCIYSLKHEQRVKQAMRGAIKDQVIAFKQMWFRTQADHDGFVECPIFKIRIQPSDAHVDHVVRFDILAERFLEIEGLDASQITVGATDSMIGGVLEDKALTDRWKDFHAKEAQLRVISAKANLSLGKKGIVIET